MAYIRRDRLAALLLVAMLALTAPAPRLAALPQKVSDAQGAKPGLGEWTVRFYGWGEEGARQPPQDWDAIVRGTVLHEASVHHLEFDWGTLPPADRVPSDRFAIAAEARFDLPAGLYVVEAGSDDALRVSIDGRRVIDRWTARTPGSESAKFELAKGVHTVSVQYADVSGAASLACALLPADYNELFKQTMATDVNDAAAWRRCLAMLERTFPAAAYPQGHSNLAGTLFNISKAHFAHGDLESARTFAEQSVAMCGRLYPSEKHPEGSRHTQLAMDMLTNVCLKQGDLPMARKYAELGAKLSVRYYGKERYPDGHLNLSRAIGLYGGVLLAHGEPAEARRYFERSLEMNRRLFPETAHRHGHPEIARSLNNLTTVLQQAGDVRASCLIGEEALLMNERLYSAGRSTEGHAEIARSRRNLAQAMHAAGSSSTARRHYDEAVKIYQRVYPVDRFPAGHADLAICLNDLAKLCHEQGDMATARGYYEQALSMYERLFPADRFPKGHPNIVTGLTNLGSFHQGQGELAPARQYHERALTMAFRLFPTQSHPAGHPILASCMTNLGFILQSQKQYGQAHRFYTVALDMHRRMYPLDRYPRGHPDLAGVINNMGWLLQEMRDYAGARPYFEKSLAMYQRLYRVEQFPDGHPVLAGSLSNLAGVVQQLGDPKGASALFERSLAMRQRLYPASQFPQGHPKLALTLENLGTALHDAGEYEPASRRCEQALQMNRSLFPIERHPQGHPDTARSLNNFAYVLASKGDYAEAIQRGQEAAAMYQRLYPVEHYAQGHPTLATVLTTVGETLLSQGEFETAERVLRRVMEMQQGLTEMQLGAGLSGDLLPVVESHRQIQDLTLSVLARRPNSDSAAYEHVARYKGRVLPLLAHPTAAVLGESDAELQNVGAELLVARQRLASIYLHPVDTVQPHHLQERTALIADATARIKVAQRRLAADSPQLSRRLVSLQIDVEQLASQQPKGAVLIDFVRYLHTRQDPKMPGRKGLRKTSMYAAFVLSRNQEVRRVELGPAEKLDRAVDEWRGRLAAGTGETAGKSEETSLEVAGRALRETLWAPLEKTFPAGTRIVYLAPDGRLTSLPWSALPGGSPGRVLLQDYAFALVPSAVAASRPSNAKSVQRQRRTFLTVGDVDFNEQVKSQPSPLDELANTVRSLVRATDAWERPKLMATPGRQAELAAATAAANDAGLEPVRLAGREAIENRVMHELRRAQWAHFDTPGLFCEPNPPERAEALANPDRALAAQHYLVTREAMTFTGLALTGANHCRCYEGWGFVPGDDGVLTSREVLALSLDKLDLVVLSDCETRIGLGDATDGVFGLQRAFQLAGARNVIASMWRSDDATSATLWKSFYAKLWKEKRSPLAALREAQLEIYRSGQGQARHPKFWAAWVLSGPGH